ncbi:MAG: ABC transporter permease [Candidatus Woesearchaeota archaeon]|nr:ABC transporter permease [Candidatus Woesearchaeota archaeon]
MIFDYFLLSFKSIRKRKLRSWLTVIGIFIGIAAVVSLISLGQGLQTAIDEQFQQLGKDKIIIQPITLGPPGSVTSKSLILTSKDLKFIENINGVEWAIGYLVKSDQVQFKDEKKVEFIIGMNPSDLTTNLELQGTKIIEGRSLKNGDKFKVVVGYNHGVDKKIWNRGIKVGDSVEIEGYKFKVVGRFDKTSNPLEDGYLFVPKDTLKEVLNTGDEESQIVVKVQQGYDVKIVADAIKEKLRRFRGEKENQETFQVSTSEQILESFNNIFGIIQTVLAGIAAISLLVGGIGIMNTMYTSVLERTRDIGIMKSIGAKNSDILVIFLIESGFLGLIGGAIGVGIGYVIGKGVEYAAVNYLGTTLLRAVFPLYLTVGSLAFSFFVGSIAGLLPAIRASKLKPVDALRYE